MAEAGDGPALAAYRAAGYALMPLVPLLLSRRAARGKEEPLRRGERYGRSGLSRPAGPLVWIHAASVGETNAVLPLVKRLTECGVAVLLTTVTVTSARLAGERLPDGAFHQYAPLDIVPFVDRFLDFWRPDLALFVESELWPAMTSRLARRGIPQLFVNARMSERSFARWKRLGRAAAPLFSHIGAALAQSAGDGERLGALGVGTVRVTGNLKFDVPPPAADADELGRLSETLSGRTVFLAASTHPGEETAAAEVHRRLRAARPDLVTILVPRHPARGAEIRDALVQAGFVVARRSAGERIAAETDIYLADTLGELGLFYRAAPVAFVGGTLVPIGGHNPIEPAQLGAAILHGPHVHNAQDIYAALDRAGGARLVEDAEALAGAVGALLADPSAIGRSTEAAAAAVAPHRGALDATLRELAVYLPALSETALSKARA